MSSSDVTTNRTTDQDLKTADGITPSPESMRSSMVTAQTDGGQEIPDTILPDPVFTVDVTTAVAASAEAIADRHWTKSVVSDITIMHSNIAASRRRRWCRGWSNLRLYK